MNQNYPNPFNPSTTIAYDLPEEGNVELVIYDILGIKVRTLVNQFQKVGSYRVTWGGVNESGKRLPSGVYTVKIVSGGYSDVKKITFVR